MIVSVIIPTYNRKHLLAYTLNNIRQQTHVPLEIIVVDDNSTDGTYLWIQEYYPDIILLKNFGNGPGAARNTGLKVATGDYIQFFDSDDLMTSNKIEEQLKALGNAKDTFVYGPYAIATAPPDEWKLVDAILQYDPLPDNDLLKWMYRGWCSITQACLFPRELIDKVGFWREDIHTHEDREYWYRIAQVITSPPIHTNTCCTIYRQHTNQLTLASERQLQRSYDSLIVDEAMQMDGRSVDKLSKLLLNARVSATKHYVNSIEHTFKLSFTDLICNVYSRGYNKVQRIRSKSNWQTMYGSNTDLEIFNHYIKNVILQSIIK